MGINKKRKKSTRMRGSQTHGRGFMKKARGSGHRGGFGMAGTGKRADQKKTLITNLKYKYFGKSGLKAKKKKYKIINVGDLKRVAGGKKEISLLNYKLLAKGEVKKSLSVKVGATSKGAVEKVEKAGGKVEVVEKNKKDEKNGD